MSYLMQYWVATDVKINPATCENSRRVLLQKTTTLLDQYCKPKRIKPKLYGVEGGKCKFWHENKG